MYFLIIIKATLTSKLGDLSLEHFADYIIMWYTIATCKAPRANEVGKCGVTFTHTYKQVYINESRINAVYI